MNEPIEHALPADCLFLPFLCIFFGLCVAVGRVRIECDETDIRCDVLPYECVNPMIRNSMLIDVVRAVGGFWVGWDLEDP